MGQKEGHADNNREKMSIRSDECGDSLSEHHTRAGQTRIRKMSAVSKFFILPVRNDVNTRLPDAVADVSFWEYF